jgi:hypothetical protein
MQRGLIADISIHWPNPKSCIDLIPFKPVNRWLVFERKGAMAFSKSQCILFFSIKERHMSGIEQEMVEHSDFSICQEGTYPFEA